MTNYVSLSHSKMTKARTMAKSCLLVGLLMLVLVPQTTTSPAAQQLPDWTPSSAEIQSETTTTINDAKNVTDYQPPPPHARPIVIPCPVDCVCKNSETVDCRGAGIRNISAISFLSNQRVTKLDLSHTDVTKIGPMAFQHMTFLEDLNLAGNSLNDIDIDAFHHPRLKSLSLQKTNIKSVPTSLFSHLPSLQSIRLDSNDLSQLDPLLFTGLPSLRQLRLDVNRLSAVPQEALSRVTTLEVLNLSYNRIKAITAGAFRNLTFLNVLVLDHNEIDYIDDDAFIGLFSLKVLELRHNAINRIEPPYFRQVPLLAELYMNNNNVTLVKAGLFQQVSRVVVLELRGNPLVNVQLEAFAFLPRLKKLILSEVKELRHFPLLNGTGALELIRIDRAKIKQIPSYTCQHSPHLRSLDLKSNLIEALPDFSHCRSLRLVDLSHNRITNLPNHAFQHQIHLHDLLLSNNRIQTVPEHAFDGLRKLKTLDMSENAIESIHPDTFLPLSEIQDVNLGHNGFPVFPSVGLENALHIKVHNNPNLREFPLPASFPRVKTLALSYAYHCCPFQQSSSYSIINGVGGEDSSLRDSIIFPSSEHGIDLTAWARGEAVWTDSNPMWANMSQQFGSPANHLNLSEADIEKLLSSVSNVKSGLLFMTAKKNYDKKNPAVTCIPEPSPFMPCQDLFDWWSLRCGVWIVFLMALLGNGAVVFVLIFARSKIDVPRFLVCNLGMADFFMGIYLGFLAVVDASTLGEFRMYAIPWQLSAGCQVAGFFGVLSSELSVFTLAVITMERNYAITHAMHLNKRLSLRHASYIMAAGWLFALIMAFLPLVGVSDYRKFAVCLPFEVGNSVSKGYVVFLMVINGVAFLILMGCYLKMYCAIRGSQAWNSNDSRIAKRMALLVFTDFLCWAPIAFFSLTAASGLQFVSLEEAKIFTVFILPLNSCCNPFLYAILTKQFKKDCVLICKAIEESRVTRGIGRCRHSSNFSNRQTPGNTNSLGDRNSGSKDGSSCQCQGRGLLKEDKLSGSSQPHRHQHAQHRHNRTSRLGWFRSPLRAFLRRIRAAEREMGESSSSANEYAYQIAEIQQKQLNRNKHHRRAESVSSDTYSTSRSDSVKAVGCGLPLRMVGRRRNSWTVTRKPSSDSNLSSSRNDSSTSAMTASTSAGTTTWRNSRSSVSSDGGSSNKGSLRDREKLASGVAKSGAKAMPPMIYVPPIDGQRRSSSMREKAGRNLPTSPLAAGILRQQSVATPTGNFVHRTVIPHVTSSVAGACLMDPSADGMACESFEAAGIRHVGAKCKPRLTRQIAVQDDLAGNNLQCPPSSGYNKCVSFNTANIMVLPSSKEDHLQRQQHYCPLHSPRSLQGVWESSIEEDYEDVAEEPKRNRSAIDKDKIFSAVASIYTNRDKNRLGLSGFIPRKLSTISSRSCSINPDNEAGTDETFEIIDESQPSSGQAAAATALLTPAVKSSQVDPAASRAFKSSNELLNVYATKRHKSNKEAELSKSDHDLYQPKMSHPPSKSSQRKSIGSSSIVRLIVTPENSSSSASSSSARVVEETRFGADDMVLVHPRPDAVQSPDSGSVLNQKELDDDDDSSQHQQEMDPLMQ
ncbi:leucine-rich repeat-containing G-protein coupled receptor 5-like isoform X1 [Daphnia pulicaria]|uniref:leucine-rich repeat-containing G-protein coupled receptor 5-like isoform X1 n=1 Tax=Daphnia pulicaria TaxID=35523 RepID=UPI001EEC091A|nr:leucine-rich repeat-containing G-protein coupled receptor 5-like isoform X1 [Daphnia pulicaria]